MIVLAIGDVVGQAGCEHLRAVLPGLKRRYNADIVVANGENAAEGNGILPSSAAHLRDSGVDVITTGNHVLRRREIYSLLDRKDGLLRPANYHATAPGAGIYLHDDPRCSLCVINLQGNVFMQPSLQSPFDCIDALLETVDTPCVLVDFHAEATSEKKCMGYYLDGRVSAVVGTHTHVPTADACILPGATGYVTDLGMCGGAHSVLGVRAELALERMRTGLPVRFEFDEKEISLSGVALEIDNATGRCRSIEQFVAQ
jgi:metallophosphoesterase, MG_246/BB_0505 family